MAKQDQVAGHGQPGRARADHRDSFSRRRRFSRQFDFSLFAFIVRGEAFQAAHGHGLAFFTQYAQYLALRLLRANPAADCGQAICFLDLLRRPDELALFDQFYKAGYVNADRAALDALGLFALQTARGLGQGFLGRITQRHLIEVPDANVRRLLGHGQSASNRSFLLRSSFFTHPG